MVVSEVEMAVTCSEDMTGTPHDLKCGIAKKAIGSCRGQDSDLAHNWCRDLPRSQREGAEYSLSAGSARIVDMFYTTGHGFTGFESSQGVASEFLHWLKVGAEFLRCGFKLCSRRAFDLR